MEIPVSGRPVQNAGNGQVLVRTENLCKWFPLGRSWPFGPRTALRAVDQVNVELLSGRVTGLVGESGSGKSTLGKTMLQLYRATSGHVYYQDVDLAGMSGADLNAFRCRMQMIFQDPASSLNRRLTAGQSIRDPLDIHRIGTPAEREEKVDSLLGEVGLHLEDRDKFPHEFSGGQRQRIGIARALALDPEFIVADEPVSALDISIQAQILNLMLELQERRGLTVLFISHDISVVKFLSSQIGVMYQGQIVEFGPKEAVGDNPLHPYTQALFSAAPEIRRAGKQRIILSGEIGSPTDEQPLCRFLPRCPRRFDRCKSAPIVELAVSDAHRVKCWLYA